MPVNHPKHFQQRLVKPLMWSILATLAIYGGSVVLSDLDAVSTSATRLDMLGWMIILGLSLANYVLRFLRWELYLGRLGSRVPIYKSLAYYIGGFAFTTTPGKAGEAVRSFYLKRHGVTYVHSLAAFFTERFVDLVAMVLLALVAALAFPAYQWPVVAISLLIIAVLPLIHAQRFHAFLDRQRTRLPSEKLRIVGARAVDLLRSASSLLKSGPLYAGLTLALIAWGAEGIAFHVILVALGINTSMLLAVGIYSISVLAGALSFMPGGLGSTEAVMILLLTLVGTDTPTAVAATIICRLATLWFAVVLGGIVVASLELTSKTNRQQAHES
jgi:uncharacterized protein (TIRG00374 family)